MELSDAFLSFDDLRDGLGRCGSPFEPPLDFVAVDLDSARDGFGVVRPDLIDKLSIAGRARIANDDAVEGPLSPPVSFESYLYTHRFPSFQSSEKAAASG